MKPADSLVSKFYEGNCTTAEARRVMDWLLTQETIPEEWESTSAGSPYEAAMLGVIKGKTFGYRTRILPWGKIAAAASVLLLCSLSLMKTGTAPVTTLTAKLNAPAGKSMHVKMVDGSEIVLSAGSSLTYDSLNYNRQRTLELDGNASFTVTADEQHPFTVKTDRLSAIALGTSFTVSSRDRNVHLFSGKVLVKDKDREVYLHPGEDFAAKT